MISKVYDNWQCPGCGRLIKHRCNVYRHRKQCVRFIETREISPQKITADEIRIVSENILTQKLN